MRNNKDFLNKDGQALLFVVIGMSIALSVAINVSVRTISSLSRTSRSNTASRAIAAAEGGIERFLAFSLADLDSALSSGNCPSPTTNYTGSIDIEGDIVCTLPLSPVAMSDNIKSEAIVSVEAYKPASYEFTLETGKVKEVNLEGYYDDLFVCWESLDSATDKSDIYYVIYSEDGIETKAGKKSVSTSGNYSAGYYTGNGFNDTGVNSNSTYGYDSCVNIDGGSNFYGLRIRVLNAESRVGVFAESGNELPLQGYIIRAIGKIVSDDETIATRSVSAVRTLPFAQGALDYAIFTSGAITK